nr:RNA polymerase sigma factor, sigma-70 family (TIGR02937) [uncultured Mediterranean phage uvMED]|tara:strand:- start:330 stop:809 length:480 start_codon:yes stop_codon:yes gene_type:complete
MNVKKSMELLFKKHSNWIDIVCSFGLEKSLAEDIVQEMYIKIQLSIEKGLDISYGKNDINYYYVFKTLRSLFFDLKRKSKNVKRVGIENLSCKEGDVDFTAKYELVTKALSEMYWYDRRVFEFINSGESVASLSRKTGIPYYSLYNTYKKVKKKLKDLL